MLRFRFRRRRRVEGRSPISTRTPFGQEFECHFAGTYQLQLDRSTMAPTRDSNPSPDDTRCLCPGPRDVHRERGSARAASALAVSAGEEKCRTDDPETDLLEFFRSRPAAGGTTRA